MQFAEVGECSVIKVTPLLYRANDVYTPITASYRV